MLIVGAKGFAKGLLQVFCQIGPVENIVFYDDVSSDLPDKIYGKFNVIRSSEEAGDYFGRVDDRYVLGVGVPDVRFFLSEKMNGLGGKLTSVISPKADIGSFNTVIGKGASIMTHTVIENDVCIGDGCLVNLNCAICHDTEIGKFTELAPNAHVLGACQIGKFSFIGAGAVVLPKISIGNHATIGAGCVVTKDVADGETVAGVPGKSLKK